jgi:hypothetical protein
MGIIYLTNKKTGITYAYDNQAFWDKEKQQSRAKRKLIGKVPLPARLFQHDLTRIGKCLRLPRTLNPVRSQLRR